MRDITKIEAGTSDSEAWHWEVIGDYKTARWMREMAIAPLGALDEPQAKSPGGEEGPALIGPDAKPEEQEHPSHGSVVEPPGRDT